MPKLKKERTRLHAPAAGGVWQTAGSSRKGGKTAQNRMEEELEVSDGDLDGLDVDAAADESEETKRAVLADALKELISMGDDDDDEDDDEDEEDMMMGMDAAKMPARGTLFKTSKPAKPAKAPKPAIAAPATTGLQFAPSAPSRAAVHAAAVARANAAAAAQAGPSPAAATPASSGEPAAATARKPQQSKQDKRAARHNALMSRLGMPGVGAFNAKRRAGDAGGFVSLGALGAQLSDVVRPRTQHKAAVKARMEDAASERRDVLFLNNTTDQQRMAQLQHSIQQAKSAATKASTVTSRSAASEDSMGDALEDVHQSTPPAVHSASSSSSAAPHVSAAPAHQKSLSQSARRNLARRELAQFSAVLHHPQFQASPLQALQLHLQNTSQMEKLEREATMLQQQQDSTQKQSGKTKNKQRR